MHSGFQLYPNYPNPVGEQTKILFCIPEDGNVKVQITDLTGRIVYKDEKILKTGCHEFNFTPGDATVYFFTVLWKGESQSIKIINNGGNSNHCKLKYAGQIDHFQQMKNSTNVQDFSYDLGDELLYIGNVENEQSGIRAIPIGTDTIRFGFAAKMPCPGTPTIDYEGQIYNTVQIFSQCWMKENLNAGNMLYAPNIPTNNNVIEKYCFNDNAAHCELLGALYYWNEMMNYTDENGSQGICPEGWHIPDDLDWQILEGAVDAQYQIGASVWNTNNWRGSDAGGNLKKTGDDLWEPPNTGATDLYEFTAIPGGYFVQGAFWGAGYKGYYWSSDNSQQYYRNMDWNQTQIKRDVGGTNIAFSVRCVKDD